MSRGSLYAAGWVLVLAAAIWLAPDDRAYPQPANAAPITVALFQGKPVQWWADRAVANRRTIDELRRQLAGDTTVQRAIELAATTYGVDAAMLARKASCESTGGRGYDPAAYNARSGTEGLFQFKPRTWSITPFAGFSPYDPLAASLAAGWMHAHGYGWAWSCR